MKALTSALAVALASMAIGAVRAESGMASYYGGGRTSSGEIAVPTGLTAAHRTLPFGTSVRIGISSPFGAVDAGAVVAAAAASSTSAVLRRANST